jgi:hypothetical protein
MGYGTKPFGVTKLKSLKFWDTFETNGKQSTPAWDMGQHLLEFHVIQNPGTVKFITSIVLC